MTPLSSIGICVLSSSLLPLFPRICWDAGVDDDGKLDVVSMFGPDDDDGVLEINVLDTGKGGGTK